MVASLAPPILRMNWKIWPARSVGQAILTNLTIPTKLFILWLAGLHCSAGTVRFQMRQASLSGHPRRCPAPLLRGPANHARVAQPEVRHSFSSHDRGVPDGDSRSSWLIAARRVQPRRQQCQSRRAARGGGPGWSRRLRRLLRHHVRTLPILPPHGTGSSTRQLSAGRAGAFRSARSTGGRSVHSNSGFSGHP